MAFSNLEISRWRLSQEGAACRSRQAVVSGAYRGLVQHHLRHRSQVRRRAVSRCASSVLSACSSSKGCCWIAGEDEIKRLDSAQQLPHKVVPAASENDCTVLASLATSSPQFTLFNSVQRAFARLFTSGARARVAAASVDSLLQCTSSVTIRSLQKCGVARRSLVARKAVLSFFALYTRTRSTLFPPCLQ